MLKLSLCTGLALGLIACNRTPLSTAPDAAVDSKPATDVAPAPDLVLVRPDTTPLGPDSPAFVPDLAVVVPDTAVPVPDVGAALRDTASVPDIMMILRDTAAIVPDGAVLRDSSIRIPDSAPDTLNVRLDAVSPTDSLETAANLFADRIFTIDTLNPAPTPNPSCTQYQDVDSFRLTFSSDAGTLNGLAVRGSAATKFHGTVGPEANKLTYHVDDLLAGGRVFIELDQGVWVGQVVLYGSGVPVARCLRGALTPQP
jgi:hypothetical protein